MALLPHPFGERAGERAGERGTREETSVPSLVNRSATFIYDAGARVYEPRTTEGATYLMQTYSAQIDPALTEAQLTDPASRLKLLPAGSTGL